MKFHRIGIVAGLFFLTACQQENILQESAELLPNELFPVEFAALEGYQPSSASRESGYDPQQDICDLQQDIYSPQQDTCTSRISASRDGIRCFWEEGDQIGIAISGGGNDQSTTARIYDDGLALQEPLYWKTTQASTVTGWYPATDGTTSLKDQRRDFVYLLKTDPTPCDYMSGPIHLRFKHQLAKVRIILTGSFSWLRRSSLSFLGPVTCKHQQGEFTFVGNHDYIEMRNIRSRQRTFEALIAPRTIQEGEKVLQLSFYSYKKYFEVEEEITLEAGKMYTFTLNANLFF